MRLRLKVAYHGGAFHGWQIQRPGVRTVEGELTKAVTQICGGEPQRLWGASRTDAGVHALDQCAAFDYDGKHSASAFFNGLNHLTPDDLSVLSVDRVSDDFHPRYSARGKLYVFEIWTGAETHPLMVDRTMHVRRSLDVHAMAEAGKRLVGTHDFTSFRGSGCSANTAVRTLWEVHTEQVDERLIRIRVTGTAFLKYMVRNIVGTLIPIGLGQKDPAWMTTVLEARDRSAAGTKSEPQGLTLQRIFYPDW
ncbi:MAG: tRNA pseudouridine38-40 synthase [Bradymonadia bacterium]|jgi:tRNA pseudouridine38-40 synthase